MNDNYYALNDHGPHPRASEKFLNVAFPLEHPIDRIKL